MVPGTVAAWTTQGSQVEMSVPKRIVIDPPMGMSVDDPVGVPVGDDAAGPLQALSESAATVKMAATFIGMAMCCFIALLSNFSRDGYRGAIDRFGAI